MIADPRFAPKRTDLPWLRRRRLPKSAQAPAPTPTAPPLAEFITGHTTGHRHEAPSPPAPTPAPPAPTAGSPAPPAPTPAPPAPTPAPPPPTPVSASLDLDEPSAPPAVAPPAVAPPAAAPPPARAPRPAPAPGGSTSLDLDGPSVAQPSAGPPAAPVPSASLDLGEPSPTAPVAAPSAAAPQRRRRVDTRVRPGERLILTPTDPTVTLTPLQSGIGTLTIEAAVSDEVGDLRLGCVYELANDLEMTMQMTQGNRMAPPHSKRPILLGSRDRFERIAADLRQCRGLRRAVVYAFSEHRQPLRWGGTLVVTTLGGGRVEVPMESLQGGDIAVLMSIYQVRGELVLRAEMQTLFGDVREASRAYGFDRITWLDDRAPVE